MFMIEPQLVRQVLHERRQEAERARQVALAHKRRGRKRRFALFTQVRSAADGEAASHPDALTSCVCAT